MLHSSSCDPSRAAAAARHPHERSNFSAAVHLTCLQNDDGQCDEEVFNDLRALPLDDMVDMLRQPAAEEAAKAGTAPGAAAGDADDGLGPAVAGAAAGPLAAQAHSSGSAALGPPSAAGPTPDAADAAQDPRLRPAQAAAPPQPPPQQQHAAMLMSSQQQPQQILQEQQQPQQQPAAGVLTSSAAAAVSGDASASDYIGVRRAPGGAGGWLAEASVLLGPAGQADPAGRRLRQAVPVGSELGEWGGGLELGRAPRGVAGPTFATLARQSRPLSPAKWPGAGRARCSWSPTARGLRT